MRIVIVEDEIKIREGMSRLIESQTEHIVLGEAENGEEGLNMIMRFKPDLVITDIRMPKMDGLEMLKELKERNIPIHAVILSGYSEFDYAKKAIQYGVDDYLLKPLAADDVKKMLETIEKKIIKEEMTAGTPEFHLRNLILGSEEETEKNCNILKNIYEFKEEGYYELFEGYTGSAQVSYRDDMEVAIKEIKTKYSDIKINYIYIDNIQKVYILVLAESKERLGDIERSLYDRLLLFYIKKPEQAIWAKQCFTRLNELKETEKNLTGLISFAIVLKPEGWITKEETEKYKTENFEEPSEIYNRIKNEICREDGEELKKAADEFLSYMKAGHFEAEDIRGAFIKNYYLITDTLKDINRQLYKSLKDTNLLRNIQAAVTWNELKNAYNDVIATIAKAKTGRDDISNLVIKKAINYIREHYKEGITQEEVSRELNITPEYLSILFKREMEINFSTFLKRFRISHAKRLLKGSDMKIYEIANEVGYSDSKYFQRVFKEETGVSPGEYRDMN